MDNGTIDRAITLRSSLKIKTVDAIIAATALTMDIPLITRNSRDFQAIARLCRNIAAPEPDEAICLLQEELQQPAYSDRARNYETHSSRLRH